MDALGLGIEFGESTIRAVLGMLAAMRRASSQDE
jgi:hypothetical protein